jgi:hypothetical protein
MRIYPISNDANHRMKFHIGLYALCALCATLGWAHAATTLPASTQPFVGAPTSQPAVNLPPIPPSEAASRSESALITIRNIEANVQNGATVRRIDQELPGMTAEIESRVEATGRILAAHASLQSMRNIQSQWEVTDKTLTTWRSELMQSARQLSQQIIQLSQMDSDWRQSLAFAEQVGASAEIIQAAKLAIGQIDRTQAHLKTRQAQMWVIARRVDEQDARVEENLAAVQQAREQLFSRLMERDSPPLWNAGRAAGNDNSAQWGGNEFGRQVATLRGYVQRHSERLGIHAFVLVAFCGALLWIKRRLRVRAGDDAELAKAMAVFDRPIATGIVLSFVASIWIHPDAPQLLWAIVGAAAIVPTVVILRRLIDPRLFGILNVLVLLFFIDQIRSISTGQPLIYRLLFLAELAGITIYLLILFRRFPGPGESAGKIARRWAAARLAVRVAIAFFRLRLLPTWSAIAAWRIFWATPCSPARISRSSFMRARGSRRVFWCSSCVRGRSIW